MVATIYNRFLVHHQSALVKSKKLERKALHCAFATLDIFDSGMISISVLERLLRKIRPKIETYQVFAFYEILQSGNRADGMLNEMQFLKVILMTYMDDS